MAIFGKMYGISFAVTIIQLAIDSGIVQIIQV